jgi:molybdopterin-containing oxidoreductase family iron-sulfur binding subunit
MSSLEKEAARKEQESILTSEARSFWQSIGEQASSKEELDQQRGQEFFKLPKEAQPGEVCEDLSRRDFFKWVGGASALFATGCQQRPKRHLIPYVHKPEGLTYGVPVWFSSVGPQGLGVLIKTREGRPIKLEGNPDHELNRGGLDVGAQAEMLNLYNPQRLQTPIDVKTGQRLAWKDVAVKVSEALQSAQPQGVRILSAPVASPSLQSVIDSFQERFKAEHVIYSASDYSALARAYEVVFGETKIPYFDFSNADVVVSVDADFLGTWLRPVDFTKQFSSRRRVNEGDLNANQLFCFESAMTLTGAAADHRFAIKPSHQLYIVLTLIEELARRGLRMDASIRETSKGLSAKKLCEDLNLNQEVFEKLVKKLISSPGRGLVVAGTVGPQSIELQLAVLALNEALGAHNKIIRLNQGIKTASSSRSDFDRLVTDALAGKVDFLLIQGCNPAYSSYSGDFKAALGKIPLVISLAYELDETAALSHIALGESHFLESWGDDESVEGFFAIQQPAIEPLFDTRSFGEILLDWTGKSQDYRLFVQNFWRQRSGATNFESWWKEKLQKGFWKETKSLSLKPKWSGAAALLNQGSLKEPGADLELVTYFSVAMGDGRYANNAWRQELPDPITKVTWSNFAAISSSLAAKLNLGKDPVIKISTLNNQIELPVFIQPGLRDDVVAVALGYGREKSGSIGQAVGQNAYPFLSQSASGQVISMGMPVQISKTNKKYSLASTQTHFHLHGRDFDILQRLDLEEFKKNPAAAKKGQKIDTFSIYNEKEFVYPGNKWGMAIDLNKCTGCQACIVACYSENNIAVVGEDQVRKGRHLAWLRLDLYYSGDEKSPEVDFEPMLCQHCDNAPCETVCPVLATVHSHDGLNDMSYNRCVGTRYCANNCPYKVRRFNYFFYSNRLADKIEVTDESPLSLMLNPDVTVRSRGVMEKCTFCVQRIRKTVADLSADGINKVPDGAIKTACQQSCPADAIEFGNLNDPEHRVTKLSEKSQGFKVLEVLNTRPSISYLPRVRNKG